jgi:hypothetical protein
MPMPRFGCKSARCDLRRRCDSSDRNRVQGIPNLNLTLGGKRQYPFLVGRPLIQLVKLFMTRFLTLSSSPTRFR